MSDILIRGMEMPEHCGYCRFRYDGICHALQKTQYSMDECPLVHVPPHGDLIDRDALRAEFPEPNEENGGWRNPDEALVHKTGIWAAIDSAPTIIPALE